MTDTPKTTYNLLQALLDKTVRDLLARVESGEATGSDHANAIKLLKDQKIEVDVTQYKPAADLVAALEAEYAQADEALDKETT